MTGKLQNSIFYFGYAFQLSSSGTSSCTHNSLYDFQIYWRLSTDTSYSAGTNSEATVTYTPLSGRSSTCSASASATTYNYYIATDSTYTATGYVSTVNGAAGTVGTPCGYALSFSVSSNTVQFEIDTDLALFRTLSIAITVFIIALLF